MQTTLLSIGIALILALVTALVGPLFVDWSRFRSEFEARASQIAGQAVRITGPIDVRILPVPIVRLQGLEVGAPGKDAAFGAQSLDAELSLASLMRGQVRAAVVRFEGPYFALRRDAEGHVTGPTLQSNDIKVDRIVMRGGRLALADAKTGADGTLEKVSFNGEMRAPGSVRGDGSFALEGQAFKYRVAISRGADGGLKLNLGLDPSDRPLAIETDGLLTFANDVPRYEGNLVLTRPAGLALSTGKTVASDPWRIESKVKVDPGLALFEQVEFQYGPDERAVRLTGAAELKIGAGARLNGVLSARQIDLDRPLASADPGERLPLAVLRRWGENFSTLVMLPIPMTIGIGIDAVTLGGATLQAVRADLSAERDAVTIDSLEFRAPGFTHLALSGRLDTKSWQYAGPLTLNVAAPPTFLAWLGGGDFAAQATKPFRLRGDVELSRERIMLDRAKAEYDSETAEGRLGYRFAKEKQPARLDIGISAPAFNLDHAISLGRAIFAGAGATSAVLERPGEVALAVDLGRVTFAGIEVKSAKADVALDGTGLKVSALSIGDFGGTAIVARGRIDAPWNSPRGALAVSIDARKLDGILAAAATVSPKVAEVLAANAPRIVPAKVDATIDLEPKGPDSSLGHFDLTGNMGGAQVSLAMEALGKLSAPETAELRVSGKVASRDDALLAALGLDALLPGKRGASLTWRANGPAGGELALDAQLSGDGFTATARGTARLSEGDSRGIDLSLAASDLAWLQRTEPFPVALKTRVAIAGRALTFKELSGDAGGTRVSGQGTIVVGRPLRIDARFAAARLNVPALIASAIGMPPQQANDANWSARPFRPLAQAEGLITLEADRVILAPGVSADDFRGTLTMTPQTFAFSSNSATLGGGTVSGGAGVTATAAGLSAALSIALSNADTTVLLPAGAHPAVFGKFSSKIDLQGIGSSPAALVASLSGSGSVTLENAQIAGLDPGAIDLATKTIERGTPVAPSRVADMVVRLMDAGSLKLPWASVPLAISGGRIRIGKMVTPAPGNELAASGTLDLLDATIDARLTMFGASESGQRPEASVVWKGPIAAPRRSIDVSALTGWLTLQSANREAKRLDAIERTSVPRGGAARVETGAAAGSHAQPPAAPALPPPVVINRPPAVAVPRPTVRAVPAPPLFTPQ